MTEVHTSMEMSVTQRYMHQGRCQWQRCSSMEMPVTEVHISVEMSVTEVHVSVDMPVTQRCMCRRWCQWQWGTRSSRYVSDTDLYRNQWWYHWHKGICNSEAPSWAGGGGGGWNKTNTGGISGKKVFSLHCPSSLCCKWIALKTKSSCKDGSGRCAWQYGKTDTPLTKVTQGKFPSQQKNVQYKKFLKRPS